MKHQDSEEDRYVSDKDHTHTTLFPPSVVMMKRTKRDHMTLQRNGLILGHEENRDIRRRMMEKRKRRRRK